MKSEGRFKDSDGDVDLTTFPESLRQQGIPIPSSWKKEVRIFPFLDPEKQKAKKHVEDDASALRFILKDGFLGANFFSDQTWNIDYPKQTLSVCGEARPFQENEINLHFKTRGGKLTSFQARIEIEIFGEKIPVLFDTGATSSYSAEAVKLLKMNDSVTASSFTAESLAKKWKKARPALRWIRGGDQFGAMDLIEVPEVKIAGFKVGPVWFATRRDRIYRKYSAKFINKKKFWERWVGMCFVRCN